MAIALTTHRSGERGQTTIEYLLLIAMAAGTAFLISQGPVADFTDGMLAQIRGVLGNVVQNGELRPGQVLGPGQAGHPGDPERLKPLHSR